MKWSKGKQKEKVNNMVLFDQASYDKLISEAPKCKLITPSVLFDRLRIQGCQEEGEMVESLGHCYLKRIESISSWKSVIAIYVEQSENHGSKEGKRMRSSLQQTSVPAKILSARSLQQT
ncbi:hypothetical protein MKX01_014938 [Papaver californicum]|nr:hypothetical protein MKX01_014938 [Papaver californicum]